CVPRLLVHVRRFSETVRRTLEVQCSRGFEHFATALQPFSVSLRLVKMQKVSPAHAPSVVITVGSMPCWKSRAEHVPASGAHTPTMLGLSAARSAAGCELAASGTSTRALTSSGSGAGVAGAAAGVMDSGGSIMVLASPGNPASFADRGDRNVTASAACCPTDDGPCACSVAAGSGVAAGASAAAGAGAAAGTGAAVGAGAAAGAGAVAGTDT